MTPTWQEGIEGVECVARGRARISKLLASSGELTQCELARIVTIRTGLGTPQRTLWLQRAADRRDAGVAVATLDGYGAWGGVPRHAYLGVFLTPDLTLEALVMPGQEDRVTCYHNGACLGELRHGSGMPILKCHTSCRWSLRLREAPFGSVEAGGHIGSQPLWIERPDATRLPIRVVNVDRLSDFFKAMGRLCLLPVLWLLPPSPYPEHRFMVPAGAVDHLRGEDLLFYFLCVMVFRELVYGATHDGG